MPSNKSNRFEAANAVNAAGSSPDSRGPFWCLDDPKKHPSLAWVPQGKLGQPWTGERVAAPRRTDERAKSDWPFRLFGNGSVGSQILTGIPRLDSLRFDPQFANCSAVWPFETGWARAAGSWLDRELRVLHAEIYPSVKQQRGDDIKDRVRCARCGTGRTTDAKGLLADEFAIPAGITSGSPDDIAIRNEEGWILGIRDLGE